ncbi:branched-chain amino acid ABC transporter permease [Nocardioides marmoriginsengisoli]|uniref:Branched-chain amino acid ABC transporter permease n=1 Tax=Nocardioides marmoriginsengisoli TaxID=661483 RepID=A0A3N0CEP2_9ACTN|nr:branched-chain amino acid ABC transporter permease [Nocardioides marmoriginsengisoli]RNL61915.1 branched-chain amino acid ABC transporter permease [Nocardioides marmoriginsengisoli]
MDTFIQVVLTGFTIGSFYALVALGYTMVYGIVRLINFAHGDLVMVGAFFGWALLQLDWIEGMPMLPRLIVAGAGAVVGTSLLALVLLRTLYTRLIGRSTLGFMLVTLSVAFALEEIVKLIFGAQQKYYPPNDLSSETIDIGGVAVNGMDLVVIGLAGTLMVGMIWFAHRTITGTAMRALAVDHDAARLMGINVSFLIAAAFVIGASLAAITGILSGTYYGRVSFDMGFALGLKAFTAAVIGGIGNIGGAVLGGLTIGLLEAFVQGYLAGAWSDAVIFGALILVLYIRPSGILGERVAERA